MPSDYSHLCRSCGYNDPIKPWGEDGKTRTGRTCPCCAVEHGYGDIYPDQARLWRAMWIEKGAEWYDASLRPERWDPLIQIARLPKRYR